MTDHIGAIYAKNDAKLSWLIRPCVVYDKNQKAEWHDWLYRCGLH